MTAISSEPTWTLDAVRQWRDAAVADGWQQIRSYPNEPVEAAATLTREGWTAMVVAWPYCANVAVWGPDQLAVTPPAIYCWDGLQQALTTCSECGAQGATVRLGWTERVCHSCQARLAPTVERRGWAE